MADPPASEPPGKITGLLQSLSAGEADSLEPLFESVYPRLREIARALFRGESPESILQPTSLVNELFLKLVRQRSLSFENREHFFRVAATLMRRIMIDQARGERRVKRDGGEKVPLDEQLPAAWGLPSADMLDIDRALQELQAIDPLKSRMIELRFFLGSTAEETAELLSLSKATVDREVRFARGWLFDRLQAHG